MTPRELIIGILTGCILIALGLIPGWFPALVEGIRNFSDALRSPFAMQRHGKELQGTDNRLPWLAVVGAGLIAISLMGYFAG